MNYFDRWSFGGPRRGGGARGGGYDEPYSRTGYDAFRRPRDKAGYDGWTPGSPPPLHRYGGSYGRSFQEDFSRREGYADEFSERPPPDEELREAVRRSFIHDQWLDAEDVQIAVERGVVTLSGNVEDYMAARYAWDDAWETPGVRGVISRIEVRGGGQSEDAAQSAGASE